MRKAAKSSRPGPRRADDPASGHDVPRAGTLHQISYCRRCGASYFATGPCPGTRDAPCLACGGSP